VKPFFVEDRYNITLKTDESRVTVLVNVLFRAISYNLVCFRRLACVKMGLELFYPWTRLFNANLLEIDQ
jgi:hypothetical protein